MVHLSEYDPRLEGIWWVEESGMSCNVYVLDEGRTLIDAGNYYGMLHELSEECDISLLENLFLTHCHFDHVGGMGELFDWCNPQVYAHLDTFLQMTAPSGCGICTPSWEPLGRSPKP